MTHGYPLHNESTIMMIFLLGEKLQSLFNATACHLLLHLAPLWKSWKLQLNT